MSAIARIAEQRQILLDGLEANDGEINLHIFEDFYPDEAHFIYELLQNAEDAGATEVFFDLTRQSCAFEHNGTRHFNEQDIRAITGIFNSSKKNSPDKIGKFGVGFKSVFVYTDTPIVYSKDYSFKILKLILPEELPSKPELGGRTRFEFPFNAKKKSSSDAYEEVKSGLLKLSETTLLFLNNIRYIRWKTGDIQGAILREEHSENHIEVLKDVDNEVVVSSHWMRFTEHVQGLEEFTSPVDALERQKVAVAYELQLLDGVLSFDRDEHMSKQMKIIPSSHGTVSVFFPAEKETSGLRFHLHAPFVPELSRASIKQSDENLPLIAQLAKLTAKSLYFIRDHGLLTGEFLAVLPNNDDSIPERYDVIRQAILEEMREHPLVPKHRGGHAPATRLVQSRAPLKALLKTSDLELLMEREDNPDWVIGVTQRNNNQDRMLGSLGIPNWGIADLIDFLECNARERVKSWDTCEVRDDVQTWLKAKSFDWLQSLYSLLYKHCEDSYEDFGNLSHVYFVKLTSGEMGTGALAYFLEGLPRKNDPFLRVDSRVFTSGENKKQKEVARRFLEKIGVREPNEQDEFNSFLQTSYGYDAECPSDEQHLSDLKRMIAFSETYPQSQPLFRDAYFLRIDSHNNEYEWATPGRVYLDEPFSRTGLSSLYKSLAEDSNKKKWPLSERYQTCGIPLENIFRFAKWAGCQTEFEDLYVSSNCGKNPNWNYLRSAPGQRAGDVINQDFSLSPQSLMLLKMQSEAASKLVWDALCRPGGITPKVMKACFQWNRRGGAHHSDSQLICSLRDLPWIPQINGKFVTPSAASASLLPEGFSYDAAYRWLDAIGFGSEEKRKSTESTARAAKRAELGIQSEEELNRALAFLRLPEDKQQRVLEEAERHQEPTELPERAVRNVELRQQRVSEQAELSPEKASVMRSRSVQVGVAEAKMEAKLYLAEQYTNSAGTMICQVCKDALPFKLPSGSYYFEAVEAFADAPKRYRETYLALCPNHAAAFLYANQQRNEMYDLVETAIGGEIEVSLGGQATTIYFTEMHLADMQACLATQQETE